MSVAPAVPKVEPEPTTAPAPRVQTMSQMRRREAIAAYLFIAPTFIGFFVFIAGPMLFSLGLSLFEWDVISDAQFIGLNNYTRLLSDPRVVASFRNTALFVLLVVTLDVVIALGLAMALQQKMPAVLRYIFRTAFFIPVVTSITSVSIVFSFLLHRELGIVNYYLGQIGIAKVPWLTSSGWALTSLAMVTVWKTFGFDLLLFIAGINNIPRHLYEAAALDGANAWQQFRRVTLPLLSPTIFFVVVVGLISNFQMFDQSYVMTKGGPGDATRTVVMLINEDSFGALRLGYGSSIAVALFIIIFILTIFQFRFSRRWVHYETGDAV